MNAEKDRRLQRPRLCGNQRNLRERKVKHIFSQTTDNFCRIFINFNHIPYRTIILILEVMIENEISYVIRGCIYNFYNQTGPGLLESAYEYALCYELERAGLTTDCQVGLPFVYENTKLDLGYRVDIIVSNRVIIEVKSVENLKDVHYKQLLTYLKLSNKKLGILVNFNTSDINTSIKRIVNNL